MPVKIRLMRIGSRGRPFYRVVAVDERNKRTGGYIELLGTYNPLTQPKEIILKQDRIDDWMKKGAQPSDGFLRIIGKAKQRLPRKPKKAQDEPEPVKPEESVKSDETPSEQNQEVIEETGNEVTTNEPTSGEAVEEATEKEAAA